MDKNKLKNRIREIISEQLELNPKQLKNNVTWLDLGLDSVATVQVVRAFRSEFGEKMTMSTSELYEYPNINELTKHLLILLEKTS